MAILKVVEKPGGRRGRITLENQREYTRVYHVTTDDPNDGPKTVRLASAGGVSIPSLGEVYAAGNDIDLGATCQSKDAEPLGTDPQAWKVTCNYSTRASTQDPAAAEEENPLDRPPEWHWEAEEFTRIADRDESGRPIANSAGWAYDPAPEVDDARSILVFVRNEAAFSDKLAKQFANAVNNDEFGGHPAGDVLCKPITAQHLWEGEFEYYKTSYRFHFKEGRYHESEYIGGWIKEGLDYGPFYKGEPSGFPPERKTIVAGDKDGVPVMVNLNGSGGLLADDADPVFNRFELHRQVSFALLQIPSYIFQG